MDATNLFSMLSLAFGLGLLHALDADHVMAVSGLISAHNDTRNSTRFCSWWAMGHGCTVLVIGGCVLLLGMAIPHQLSDYAEFTVGGMLVIIGLWLIFSPLPLTASNNTNRGVETSRPHHSSAFSNPQSKKRISQPPSRNAMVVGILHGMAGSAPILMIMPLSLNDSALLGLTYLLLFSTGVVAAMLLFGGILNGVYRYLSIWGTPIVKLSRLLIAGSAIIVGVHLLTSPSG